MKGLFRHLQSYKFWRSFPARQKWFLIFGLLLALALVYFAVSMSLVSRAELNLEKLRRSFGDETVCHEACAAAREEAKSALIKELRDDQDSKALRRLKGYFLDESVGIGFRISLADAAQEIFGPDNPPDYMKAYLADGKESLLKAAVISAFSASGLGASDNPLDYYYEILSGDDDLIVKEAAIRALSSSPGKEESFNQEQLERIKKIIFDSGSDQRLRRPLILLLGDYYPFFPSETKDMLLVFYKTESSGDAISRAFAADILNRLGEEELAVPEISAEEWEEYYNN